VGEFFAGVPEMNALADRAPGFIWRFVGDPSPGEPWPDDPLM